MSEFGEFLRGALAFCDSVDPASGPNLDKRMHARYSDNEGDIIERKTFPVEAVPVPFNGEPIPMLLTCPSCGSAHIDLPDLAHGWTNPPHRTHLCHYCGHLWRPALVNTIGVAKL